MILNKELGQVFTPQEIVTEMVNLIENTGKIIEPSCGDGIFLKQLPNAIGIEYDERFAGENVIIDDFFNVKLSDIDTFIGNPPYIQGKNIFNDTRILLTKELPFSANLYVHFMYKCVNELKDGGELIFIVPRDFIKATSAIKLNEKMINEGSFTYWRETGDAIIFEGAAPNTVIFRWQKGLKTNPLGFILNNGAIEYNASTPGKRISDIFKVMVGGASGKNEVFIAKDGNLDIITSRTFATGELGKCHYYTSAEEAAPIVQYKEQLLARKIKKFSESNWFEWGRKIRPTTKTSIFVNCKTREMQPFFKSDCQYYDGSVLVLEPIADDIDIDRYVEILNNINWEALGFKVGGRLMFGQRTLSNVVLPI